MWQYQKRLEYPVNIKNTNPKLAQLIVAQYGGAYCKSLSTQCSVLKLLHATIY